MFCPFCGAQNTPDATHCFNCNQAFLKNTSSQSRAYQPDWEEHGHILNPVSFFITVRDILFSPSRTFSNLKPGNTVFNAFLFGLLGSTIGGCANTLWQYSINLLGLVPQEGLLSRLFGTSGHFIVMLCIVPVASALAILIMSSLLQLLLKLLGSGEQGFSATLKVYAYSLGATSLLGIIPFCGSVTGFIWFLVLCLIGLKEAHRTTHFKAGVALFLPILLCCVCLALAGLALVMSGLGLAYFTNLFGWQ